MRDLQGYSAASSSSYSFDDDDDSENITQPPPQHPLLEPHQLDCECEQEKSISDDMMEENLFDCAIQYQQQADNFINYCRSNDPHQSINKPTDGTGSNIINYHYDHQRGSPRSEAVAADHYDEEEAEDDDDDETAGDDDFEDDADELVNGAANLNHHHHHNHHNNNHHHQQQQLDQQQQQPRSRPTLAASSPIQVPARRTRKDFYSMKLNMLKVEESAAAEAIAIAATDESTTSSTTTSASSSSASGGVVSEDSEDYSPVRRGDRNRPAIENMPAFDDDDAFLDREFNENHYNHYLLDGLDDEHLTAEEDPMRLFASIQALAKSLHEDAELFGSLPPKRTLESPIRSIAFV